MRRVTGDVRASACVHVCTDVCRRRRKGSVAAALVAAAVGGGRRGAAIPLLALSRNPRPTTANTGFAVRTRHLEERNVPRPSRRLWKALLRSGSRSSCRATSAAGTPWRRSLPVRASQDFSPSLELVFPQRSVLRRGLQTRRTAARPCRAPAVAAGPRPPARPAADAGLDRDCHRAPCSGSEAACVRSQEPGLRSPPTAPWCCARRPAQGWSHQDASAGASGRFSRPTWTKNWGPELAPIPHPEPGPEGATRSADHTAGAWLSTDYVPLGPEELCR